MLGRGGHLARADSFALPPAPAATSAPPRTWHPKGFVLLEKVNFQVLNFARGGRSMARLPPTPILHPRCLSSVNPGSLPPQGPQTRPLLSSAAHPPRPRAHSQATCARRRSRQPAGTMGLRPGAERRLGAHWELRSLLQRLMGSVVPQVGGKDCSGWGPRAGGLGVWERLWGSHLAGGWRKNLASRCPAPAGSGVRSEVPGCSCLCGCEKPPG